MKKNKGFTLVELLAVIAILAILVIIALPNVLSMFNQAKIGTFVTEAQTVFKSAQQDFLLNNSTIFAFGLQDVKEDDEYTCKKLNMTGNTKLKYYVKMSSYGFITEYYVYDSTFAYYYNNPISATNTTGLKIEKIEEEATKNCAAGTLQCGLYNKADTESKVGTVKGYDYVKDIVDGNESTQNPCLGE